MENCLIGYVYDSEGYYEKKYFIKDDADTVARFICQFPVNDKVITDMVDNLTVSTIGCFLNQVPDKSFLEKLQAAIIPYQIGDKELKELEFTETEPGYLTQKEFLSEMEEM